MAAIPSEFFTLQSIGTLTGATGLCFVVTNGIRRAFGFDPRWLGLVVAQIVAFAGVALAAGTPVQYALAIPNGFLLFSTAAGAAAMTSCSRDDGAIGFFEHRNKYRFFGEWF
jgi:hypothetical protein